jgi:hypothetical protein
VPRTVLPGRCQRPYETPATGALDFIEDFIRDQVLPRYANTHTESSGTGLQTSRLREDARRLVRDAVGGTDDHVVIFCGSGATAAVNKLVGILELRLHHNLVVALLNDLFGIQARGGCSCAGPYGHRLLAIDAAHSHAYPDEVVHGCDGIKPGWTRVNFNYFITDTVRDYLVDAVDLVATYGHRLLTDYRFDPHTGLWHHHAGPTEPPLRLRDVSFDTAGRLTYPQHRTQAGEDALAGYLDQARALLAAKVDRLDDGPTGLPDDFEALRWFHLPRACLPGPPSGPSTACGDAQPAAV